MHVLPSASAVAGTSQHCSFPDTPLAPSRRSSRRAFRAIHASRQTLTDAGSEAPTCSQPSLPINLDVEPQGQKQNATAATARRCLLMTPLVAATCAQPAFALSLQGAPCRGMNGYSLQKCLREARKEQEEGQEEGELAVVQDVGEPGTLVTLPSGRQYREIFEGYGSRTAQLGDELEIQYTVYQLTKAVPILLWSLGTGFENRDDVDDVYRFRFGDPGTLPAAAVPVVEGMKQGGRRRVLVQPQEGWVDDLVEPRPPTFGGKRRLISHRREPLLFEACTDSPSLEPLKNLGLDPQEAAKLAVELHAHSI